MYTKAQINHLKQIISRSNNKLFLKFLFLIGVGESEIPKPAIKDILENCTQLEPYFEQLSKPYVLKFIDRTSLIVEFIDVLAENSKQPIKKIQKKLEEAVKFACPLASLERRYLNTKGEIK